MKIRKVNRNSWPGRGIRAAPLVVGVVVAACSLPALALADADNVLIPAGQPLIPAETRMPVDDVLSKAPARDVLEKSEQAALVVESAREGKLLLEATASAPVRNPVSGDAETVAVADEASLDGEVNGDAVGGSGAVLDQPTQVATASVDQNVYNTSPRDYRADEGAQAVAINMGGNKEASAVIGEQHTRSPVSYALLLALFALIGLVPVSRRRH